MKNSENVSRQMLLNIELVTNTLKIDTKTSESKLSKIKRLRMDRQNISKLTNLAFLRNITHLYLQYNNIRVIPKLELPNLEFLILSNNKIEKLCGIDSLPLILLDLSNNRISDFEHERYPKSLAYLLLKGNPVEALPDYRLKVVENLDLEELDEVSVSRENIVLGKEIIHDNEQDSIQRDYDSAISEILARSRQRQELVFAAKTRKVQ